MNTPENVNDKQFPAVNLVYDITLKSYEIHENRLNEVNGGLERLITWISSITIGAIALIKGTIPQIDLHDNLLYIALVLFLISIVIGIIARFSGFLQLISPAKLKEKWLGFSEYEFKIKMIVKSAEYYTENLRLINIKGLAITIVSWIFLGEMLMILIWIILGKKIT